MNSSDINFVQNFGVEIVCLQHRWHFVKSLGKMNQQWPLNQLSFTTISSYTPFMWVILGFLSIERSERPRVNPNYISLLIDNYQFIKIHWFEDGQTTSQTKSGTNRVNFENRNFMYPLFKPGLPMHGVY